jgi:hypothetical protein
MIITHTKFESPLTAKRARFISPVFEYPDDQFCFSFRFNIRIENDDNDGLELLIEDYLNPSETKSLWNVRGPLDVDKWHQINVQVEPKDFSQFRVIKNKMTWIGYGFEILNFNYIFNQVDI